MGPGRRRWMLVAGFLLLVLAAAAEARLGGGQSYSGGGSSSGGGYSGGGGGGDGGLLFELVFRLLFELVLHYPSVGIPLVLVVLAAVGFMAMADAGRETVAVAYQSSAPSPARQARVGRLLGELKRADPTFSRVVFMDFLNSLYAKVHAARGHEQWEPLRPYLSPEVYGRVANGRPLHPRHDPADAVEEIVIGSLTVLDVMVTSLQSVRVRIRSNLVEVRGGRRFPMLVEETWILGRGLGSRSPTPEQARTLGCPSCGAKVELSAEGTCTYCDSPVCAQPVGWQLGDIQVTRSLPRPPLQLAPGGVEAGTHSPTVAAEDLGARGRELQDRHPSFDLQAFRGQVRTMFLELQAGWSAGDVDRLRPYESHMLYATHRMWIERYRREGLVNHVEDVEVSGIELVRIELDAYYESITVRVYARTRDYTVEQATGRLVDGNKDVPRVFSEYWTLVRTVGAKEGGAAAGSCPSCGAPLDKVNQAGVCEYCDSEIVSGEFGWVLAWIEQDEEYAG